jgi:hypothetical protein
MNAQVEESFVEWLDGLDLGATVYAGSSATEIDPSSLAIVVSVPSMEHPAGPLYKATVEIGVMGPAFHESLSLYRSTASSVLRAIKTDNLGALADALLDYAESALSGVWVQDSGESIAEDRWQCTIRLVCGLTVDSSGPTWRDGIDGGGASASYLVTQQVDGGTASTTYLSTQQIDGGLA